MVAGFDLDMSYITDRLIAMSFPAEHMRAVYRNPMCQVKRVLDLRHPSHYKVYNLCIEESYNPGHFHDRVEVCPFDDNHVPPLSLMKLFCESIHSWLSSDPQNVAVVHCMAGKGRTGLMVCAYLVYTGMTAEGALQLYASRRTTNNQGVTIASQRRYVGYWAQILAFRDAIFPRLPPEVHLPQLKHRNLIRIRLYDTININSVLFVVSELRETERQLYQQPVEIHRDYCRPVKMGHVEDDNERYYRSLDRFVMQMDTESSMLYKKNCLDYYFEEPLQVVGDVRVVFYEKSIGGRLFYTCFNTAFVTNSLLQFYQQDLDKVGRKGKSICGSSFCFELFFGPSESLHPQLQRIDSSDDSVESLNLTHISCQKYPC